MIVRGKKVLIANENDTAAEGTGVERPIWRWEGGVEAG